MSGEDIRLIRESLGLTRDAMAKRLNISERTLQNCELGAQVLGHSAQAWLLEMQSKESAAGDARRVPTPNATGCSLAACEQAIDSMGRLAADPSKAELAKSLATSLDISLARAWSILFRESLKGGQNGEGGTHTTGT